jgi:8-hydroxy-5-deazaflavin:NADPH oxidoreductase
MNLTFVGIGNVGLALAPRFSVLGHTIIVAARDARSESVHKAKQELPSLRDQAPADAVRAADIVFLATPFAAAENALAGAGSALDGKIIVDCTNPVGPGLTHGLESRSSGTTQLQAKFPGAHFVKAFTIYGYENFASDPRIVFGQSPTMMIAGNDAAAKTSVASLVDEAGWAALDVGNADAALHLEHMTLLWIKLVRMGEQPTRLTWARLVC